MAEVEKKTPPSPISIDAPEALRPLMQAFQTDSEREAKKLLLETARAIYGKDQCGSIKDISKDELDGILSLMQGLNPTDAMETLYASQIIACHMLGMRKLADTYHEDQRLGLCFLRFSSEALQQLQKKRNGSSQNITVNYIHNDSGKEGLSTFKMSLNQKEMEVDSAD